jgi:DNA-binding NarL/FixJ family response regulator
MFTDISILVADDHPLLLKGLVDSLKKYGCNVVASETNGADTLTQILNLKPDIALLDIEMPLLNAFEIIRKCIEAGTATKFVILTSHKEKGFIVQARQLNIKGYLLKDEPFDEIINCIKEVSVGKDYFSKTFEEVYADEVSPALQKLKLLSPSERTIVRYIAQGFNSKEMAEQLSISVRTIHKHRSNIIAKMDLESNENSLTDWVHDNRELLNDL